MPTMVSIRLRAWAGRIPSLSPHQFFLFYPIVLLHCMTGLASLCRLSVRPPVCLSVMLWFVSLTIGAKVLIKNL